MINLEKFKHQSWLDGRIIAINADCKEVMAEIGDKEIELCLCDPPYGGAGNDDWDNKKRGGFGGRFDKYHINCERTGGTWSKKYQEDGNIKHWDFAPDAKYFEEIFRISKEQIIWGGNYFELPATRCFLIWKKLTISENFSMAMAEYAWTSFNKNAKIFEYAPQDSSRFHPTQKAVPLMAWCLNNYSKENDLIFDAFAGSFTTAIACIRTNRRFIGCELDSIYFEKACERIETELKQLTLF